MEANIRTDMNGAGATDVAGPVFDATIIRGWGNVVVAGSMIAVTNCAPNDAVTVAYGDAAGHVLMCPFDLIPQAPHQICSGAWTGSHPMHVRPAQIHCVAGVPDSTGLAQAQAARDSYGRQLPTAPVSPPVNVTPPVISY